MGTPRQKRVTVAILLSTLGLCALFLAQGTMNLFGAGLVDDAPIVGAPREELAAAAPEAESAVQPVDHEKVKLMLRGPEPEALDMGVPDGDVTTEEPGSIEDARACDGGANLTAVLMSSREEWSMVAVNNVSRLYRVGSTLDGKTVHTITQDRAYLAYGPRYCYLAMFEPGAQAAETPRTPTASSGPTPTPNPSRSGSTQGGITQQQMSEGITRQSDRNFTVQRSFLNEVMENQGEIMRTARVIPHEESGRVVGVKMYGIRRNSVLGQLGVQNGDMLRTINGFDLTTPDSALEAYTRLTGADNLTLSVVRRGQPITIEYNVQ